MTYNPADYLDADPGARPRFRRDLFREALERDNGIPHDHPKAERLFDLAWEDGHSYGLDEVSGRYGELAELIDRDWAP